MADASMIFRSSPRSLLLATLTAATIALAACGDDAQGAGQPAPGGPGGPGGMPATPVEVGVVATGSIARSVSVSGVVEPIRVVGVNSQLAGALLGVNVEEGDQVGRGAVLARLDDRELRAQLLAAEANFQVAEAAYERARQLRDRQVITLPEFERERTAYASAAAQLDQLRARVGYATVNAPIAGVVVEKNVETGDVVGVNARLFTLADVSTMVARVGVSELDVVALRPGDQTTIQLDAFPGRTLSGRIRRVFPAGDPQTRLVPVEVTLGPDAAQLARPGFLARVTFALGARENVLLVPASAIVSGTGGTSAVFVVEDGVATRRIVETGLTSEGRVEITGGLSAGETIVVTGANGLRDGVRVRAVGESSVDPSTAGEG
ncbi:MAG TPA: efflux RND transporter periplasmic adaptor subunit [Longimicrobiales bacterium]